MKLDRVIPFAHQLLGKAVSNGEIAIDATMGNGHDTVFLATLVGDNGKVFSFDIQKDALHATKEKLTSQKLQDIVSLHLCGHEHIIETVPSTFITNDDVLEIADYFGVSFEACLFRIAYRVHAIDGNTEATALKKRAAKYQPEKERKKRHLSYAKLYVGLIDCYREQLSFQEYR